MIDPTGFGRRHLLRETPRQASGGAVAIGGYLGPSAVSQKFLQFIPRLWPRCGVARRRCSAATASSRLTSGSDPSETLPTTWGTPHSGFVSRRQPGDAAAACAVERAGQAGIRGVVPLPDAAVRRESTMSPARERDNSIRRSPMPANPARTACRQAPDGADTGYCAASPPTHAAAVLRAADSTMPSPRTWRRSAATAGAAIVGAFRKGRIADVVPQVPGRADTGSVHCKHEKYT